MLINNMGKFVNNNPKIYELIIRIKEWKLWDV